MSRSGLAALLVSSLVACGGGSQAQAPRVTVASADAWTSETWLEYASAADVEALAVQARGDVVDVVFNDATLNLGAPGLAVASQGPDGARVRFPFLGSCPRGRLLGRGERLAIGCPVLNPWGAALDADGALVKLDGALVLPPPATTQGARCPTLAGLKLSSARLIEATDGARTSVTALVLGEGRDAGTPDDPAPLRLVQCSPDTGDEVITLLAERVRSAALGLTPAGQPVVALVDEEGDRVRLRVTRLGPSLEPPFEGDRRVPDALAACAALRIEYGPLQIPDEHRVGAELSPNGRICAMLLSDERLGAAARDVAIARCRAGEARSCTVAGGLMSRVWVALSFTFEQVAGGDPALQIKRRWLPTTPGRSDDQRARELFVLGCRGGDEDACMRLLDAERPADAARSALAADACARGNPFACDLRRAFGVQ